MIRRQEEGEYWFYDLGSFNGSYINGERVTTVRQLENGDVIPESEVISEYLEELYPEPRLLGADPRETAKIRTVSRIADIYLMNNMFMLSGQTRASTRNEGVVALLSGQVIRGVKALAHYLEGGDFAVCGRLTRALAMVPRA